MGYSSMKIKKIDFAKYLEDLSFSEVESIRSINTFADDVGDYADNGQSVSGTMLPWSKTHEYTRLGQGELSIWAGQSGSGKSLLLGQVITGVMNQGQKSVIASLEMSPKETLYRMICQSATCKASRGYSLSWLNYFTGKMWIYDELDRVDTNRILGMAHYAAHELGVNHIVIDSLTKCGVGRDDYASQAKFVDKLQWCAKTWNVHVHLVCHMRKSDTNGKNDIRGAAEITDLADNVYVLNRNKNKENAISAQLAGQPFKQEVLEQADAYLEVAKNRKFGEEPTFALWYDKRSGIYTGSKGEPLIAMGV